MKKKLSLVINKKTLPFFSAIFIASLIFTIFLANQKVTKSKQPIFSKYTTNNIGKPKSEIGYKNKEPEYVEGQVLVKYKDDRIKLRDSEGENEAKKIRGSKSVKKIKSIKEINTEIVEITDGKSVKDKIKDLKTDTSVEYAEPNYIAYPSYTPDDPQYGLQWALENTGQFVKDLAGTADADMDVSEMWDIEEDHGEDIVVAVIDTGVALNHPDISASLIQGYNAVTDGATEPYDVSGHGTHVTGVIVGIVNNSSGISGISRMGNVKVMPIAAADPEIGGGFTYEDLIESVVYATGQGADIINMSLGGPSYSDIFRDTLADFPGLIIVAAGNSTLDNDVHPDYPASYNLPNIVSVAATDQNDNLADFSNYGETSVDVAAPGTNILSAEGYRAFDEGFESVVEPDIGSKFTQLGVETNWGTYYLTEFDETILFADIGYFSSGSYASNANSYLTSSSINIESTLQSYVIFEYYCDMPDTGNDSLSFQVFNGTDWTTFASYTGAGGGLAEFDVTEYKANDFQIRFHWQTDAVSDLDYYGCYIDTIKIVDSSASQASYQYMDGTSMACPYATAVAAMVWGKNPTISVDVLKSIILGTGDSADSLSGVTVTGKRINAYNAYSANPEDYLEIPEEPGEPGDPVSTDRVVFHPDRRCHWKKPSSPTWVKLEPSTENGVSGMMLTWAQYDADKINIKIDDGTGNYPWKIEKTSNDGHEFLANVQSWQNIMIKPINHCKEGEYSLAVSHLAYPGGWYGQSEAKLASSNSNTLGYSTESAVLGTSTESEENTAQEETPMVPETGSNDLVFLTSSLAIVGFATYFILDDRSRKIALRGFEKKSKKNI